VSYFTLRWLKNNNVAKTPYGIGNYLGPGQSVLSFIASRSSFLIGELLLGNLSETVVVVGNAPHDRPSFLVGHLVGNRASLLCTKAPMLRVPETNFLHGITSIALTEFRRQSAFFGHARSHLWGLSLKPRQARRHLGRWLIQGRLAADPKKAHPRISTTSGMPNAMVAHISSFAHGTSAWDLISL